MSRGALNGVIALRFGAPITGFGAAELRRNCRGIAAETIMGNGLGEGKRTVSGPSGALRERYRKEEAVVDDDKTQMTSSFERGRHP
jgi:hypothetical protein